MIEYKMKEGTYEVW